MTIQIPSSELAEVALKSHASYYSWLCQESGISGPLAQLFFETDFRWDKDIPDDENRGKEGLALREQYAIFVITGQRSTLISKEEWKYVDILKKSILGPVTVFEVLVCLARDLNDLLNLDQESHVDQYFGQLMENVGFNFYDEEDWDESPEKVKKYWKKLLDRVLDRTYLPDGEGGLFPLDVTDSIDEDGNLTIPDQRKRTIWSQMNDWADQKMENLDDFGDDFN